MKVNDIRLNCKSSELQYGRETEDFTLFLFRTAVIFELAGEELGLDAPAVMIYPGARRQFFKAPAGRECRFDMISFRMSTSDKQYAAALNVPIGIPIALGEGAVIGSVIKNMSLRTDSADFLELSMKLIFAELRYDADRKGQSLPPRFPQLKELRGAIYDDPMRDWSAERICRDMNISKTYFHRIYMTAFGVSCRQDVIESRLLYAERLLRETELPISAVAEECGYDSDSYFMRQFRQHRGCTPTEYRRRAVSSSGTFKKTSKKT